jgi:hypothetical protein
MSGGNPRINRNAYAPADQRHPGAACAENMIFRLSIL